MVDRTEDLPLPVWAPHSPHRVELFPDCTPSQGLEWFCPRKQSCIAGDAENLG